MDRWYWKGIYHDGSVFTENDVNAVTGRTFSSNHLDATKLKALILEPRRPGINRIVVHVSPGDVPRRKWRQYIASSGARGTCHMISVERNNTTFYTFLRPDGKMVISTNSEASECNISQQIYVDTDNDAEKEEYAISLGDGSQCGVFKLKKNSDAYYHFFMPNGDIIISTDEKGYEFSL